MPVEDMVDAALVGLDQGELARNVHINQLLEALA